MKVYDPWETVERPEGEPIVVEGEALAVVRALAQAIMDQHGSKRGAGVDLAFHVVVDRDEIDAAPSVRLTSGPDGIHIEGRLEGLYAAPVSTTYADMQEVWDAAPEWVRERIDQRLDEIRELAPNDRIFLRTDSGETSDIYEATELGRWRAAQV